MEIEMLDGFELIRNVSGVPSVTVTKNGISFNRPAIEKLGKPGYVQVYMDADGHRMAIVPCQEDADDSREFFKSGRNISNGVRWNNYDLKTMIERLMGWTLDEVGWKTEGLYSSNPPCLIFSLDEAKPISHSGAREG